MIHHTMIVTFENPIPDADLDQFLADIEQVMRASGHVTGAAARRHIPVPAERGFDAPAPTAIVQFAVADAEALNASFSAPGLEELIGRWQSRHPYRVVWANHEPF